VLAQSKPHYAPDVPLRLDSISFDLDVDPRAKTLAGKVEQCFTVVAPEVTRLKLDQVGLEIHSVEVDGKLVSFHTEASALEVALPPTRAGAKVSVSVKYQIPHPPRRGIYFTGPESAYPQKPYQTWTQGQDEDSRYWFPTFDYPNQKATLEMRVRVPQGFTAVSNGALVDQKTQGEYSHFHYRLGQPIVPYLVSLVVAEFSFWEDLGPRGLPVQYFVAPGREEDGKRAFGNTPKMIESFEKKLGVAFPYEKYAQTAVQDFIFGGMENASSTTQTDRTLHSERAHPDFSSDPLVSHELAHQWFGDLVTCRDWSHGWLNEGFATFMERVWIESAVGPGFGAEEAKYYSYMDLQDHFSEDRTLYRRPIVCNQYVEPIDLFDTHLYQKGGLVLNLLRATLGEQTFWACVRHYLKKHSNAHVETLDLIRAIEEVSGRNLRRFFDEWVFAGGYPELECSYTWSEGAAEIVIEQKQTLGRDRLEADGVVTPLFHLEIPIELTLQDGSIIRHTLQMESVRERVVIACPKKPKRVRLDPGGNIPKTLKFPRPKEMLLDQLMHDPDCLGRIEAAQELKSIADTEITRKLGEALANDVFWGVQLEIAQVLAEIATAAARDALLMGLHIPHGKARAAVVRSLGSFKDTKVASALQALAQKDQSDLVESQATLAFARSRALPGQKNLADATESFLKKQSEKSSHLDLIRARALQALAELPGIAQGERETALAYLIASTRAGEAVDARVGAIQALAQIARSAISSVREQVFAVFTELSREDRFQLRRALVDALIRTERREAVALLDQIAEWEIDGRIKRAAVVGAETLRVSGDLSETLAQLRVDLEKLQLEHRKLQAQVQDQQVKR
jgi:aminopeptidase N